MLSSTPQKYWDRMHHNRYRCAFFCFVSAVRWSLWSSGPLSFTVFRDHYSILHIVQQQILGLRWGTVTAPQCFWWCWDCFQESSLARFRDWSPLKARNTINHLILVWLCNRWTGQGKEPKQFRDMKISLKYTRRLKRLRKLTVENLSLRAPAVTSGHEQHSRATETPEQVDWFEE